MLFIGMLNKVLFFFTALNSKGHCYGYFSKPHSSIHLCSGLDAVISEKPALERKTVTNLPSHVHLLFCLYYFP